LTFSELGDVDRCLRDARTGRSEPGEMEPYLYSVEATCLANVGRVSDAFDVLDTAIGLSPESVPLRFNAAVALERMGDLAGARTEAREVLARSPDYPDANLLLAQLLDESGFRVPAIFQYLRFLSVEIGSRRADAAARNLGRLIRSGGEDSGATGILVEEGDFTLLDSSLGTLAVSVFGNDGEFGDASQIARLATVIEGAVDMADRFDDVMLRETFAWRHSIDPLIEIRDQGYLDAIIHLAFFGVEGAEAWVNAHPDQVEALVEWFQGR
jgi:tetratricopeptide (TPR) repeat protein